MAHKGVPAGAGLDIPDPDGGVQRPRHNVHPVKLSNSQLLAISMALYQIKKERVRAKEACASAEAGSGGGRIDKNSW